jgi:hypothetical protein
MDLLQGHYVSSVSRDVTVPGKPGALEVGILAGPLTDTSLTYDIAIIISSTLH